MGRITFTPCIYERDKRQDNLYTVRIRVGLNKQSKFITTNLSAEPSQLTKQLKIKDPNLRFQVEALMKKMRQAVDDVDQFMLDDMSVDEAIRIMERKIKGESFRLDFMSFWVEAIQSKPKDSQVNYMCALHALQAFYGKTSMDISEITIRRMYAFEDWLVEKYGKGARAVRMYTAAVSHIHSLARRKYNSVDTGEIPIRNPFEFYKPPKQKPPKHRDVELEILQDMINTRAKLAGPERRAVDSFLLSFALMGMNAVDLYTCAPPRNGILIYNRSKTKDKKADRAEMHVKIDERILPLYEEYRDRGKQFAFKYHFIHSNHRQFNASLSYGLKKYRERKGLPPKKPDFYSARHTWSTAAFVAGVEQSLINDCLCHGDESMKMTNIYIHKDWSVMWRANEKVLDLLDWSPLV